MSPERWRQVEEIFQMALDLAPDERPQYMDRACAGDTELRYEVEAMLAQHRRAEAMDGFLDPTLDAGDDLHGLATLLSDETDSMEGQQVGAYKVIREIGRGGMGAVYLAERADNAFQRRVAIKIIKRGMDTDFILRRFRRERRILAALDHTNIARLLDGGATGAGQPYFVMEYIEGQPLYEYCDTRRLGVRERLRLFCQICEAVEYAHRNQVVHRDIKPSNILVSVAGVPKLFDFGIAKLLNPELASDTAPQTATAMRMMTVEYASPEQVQGLPVTFLSDVYSLGVLLYELLTGHRPYSFGNHSLLEVVRVICEAEPERPSVAIHRANDLVFGSVDGDATTITRLCELRGGTLESLRRELSGGPDQIVLQALRKAPAERYQSAAALREDILGFLEGRPINAPLHVTAATDGASPSTAVFAREATKSIAVLPLKLLNVSAGGDTDDSYLSVGLADALITRLSNVRSLTVRPTSSVMRYGEGADPLAAGSELKVDFVLDGRVKRAGERIRVSLQLLDVRHNTSGWAHQCDVRFTDVLELEDVISTQVAEALVPRLTVDERRKLEKRGTNNPEAYEAYLRGRFFLNQRHGGFHSKALASLQKAVALDLRYALAHAGLAEFYHEASILGVLPAPECRREARAAARRALDLDDSLGEAHAVLAFITAFSEWDWTSGERQLKRALELNPNNSLAREWYAVLLMGTGRTEESLEEIRRASELDPFSRRLMGMRIWMSYQARCYEESIERSRQLIDLDEHFWEGYALLGNTFIETGQIEEAMDLLQRALRVCPAPEHMMYLLCHALVVSHRPDEARELLDQLMAAVATRHVKPPFVAMAFAALGERDTAFEWFEKALPDDEWLVWLVTEPKLDRLRDDERFDELLRRTNRPPRRA